jgi:membrane protein implicated in regulation of membrane protease activity
LAVSAGLCAAFLVFRFVLVPLYKRQSTSALPAGSFIGSKANVTVTIPQGKYGQIAYSSPNGNTYSAPAKSEDGCEIARGTAVEIIYIEKNTYFVRSVEN